MFIRYIVCILSLFTPSIGWSLTSEQARVCFTAVIADASQGDSFASLVKKYVNIQSIARSAAKSTPYRNWDNTPTATRETLLTLTESTLRDDDGTFSQIALDSVKIVGRGKAYKGAYELSGTFKTKHSTDSFAVVFTGNCSIISLTWNNINLARHIGNQIQ